MKKLVLIDGNSIINRAFYGIMGSKMLMTEDGTYTNAVYGFLTILFRILEDINPEYMAIAFDLRAPTHRHKLYDGYKANRHGMPDELAQQFPILKDILASMKIEVIEKEGYEADDILGTLAKWGQDQKLDVTIVTGDRDSFQLIDKHIKVRIPRTKVGKTETEEYNTKKIQQEYGLKPKDLIEIKGLAGDTSDNIPGVAGVGEKTAINLIRQYQTIDGVYENIEQIKGKLREKLEADKEIAFLSRTLGTINTEAPIDKDLNKIKVEEWDKEALLEKFKKLRFHRFIDRFDLNSVNKTEINADVKIEYEKVEDLNKINNIKNEILENKKIFYYLNVQESVEGKILGKIINGITIFAEKDEKSYFVKDILLFKEIFEDSEILKIGYKQREDFILLKQAGIEPKNMMFDVELAAYILNSNINKYPIEYLAEEYLSFDLEEYLKSNSVKEEEQLSLFNQAEEKEDIKSYVYVYVINKLHEVLEEKMKQTEALDLFNTIEMPIVEVLANMQYQGIYVDKNELVEFGNELKEKITILTNEIFEMAGKEFNINSTKQLGEILFEKLKLPVLKKTKTGYSTDSDVLEKLKHEHPIIEKILDYRQLVKLNSTYVEGMIPYINKKTGRIHSSFHQTVTATGRISSTEPNLQNIPTRFELGRKLRKVFKPEGECIYIDADYSQIELRVLAHISGDRNMIKAFKNGEDIHEQAASRVLSIPIEEVTKEQRTRAKAVNFGIVYGISDFGLAEQIGVPRKEAKEYIEQYLKKYAGIKRFMDRIVEEAKEQGYVETLYHRRRYVPELKSNNYMVRQFGHRVAMNTPIQGTAADIMKIAMFNVYNKLKNMKSKLVLQVHDELLIETYPDEIEQVKDILKKEMESVIKLKVPLLAELSEGTNWLEAK